MKNIELMKENARRLGELVIEFDNMEKLDSNFLEREQIRTEYGIRLVMGKYLLFEDELKLTNNDLEVISTYFFGSYLRQQANKPSKNNAEKLSMARQFAGGPGMFNYAEIGVLEELAYKNGIKYYKTKELKK